MDELESLPIGDGELDAATLMLVLHHIPDPADVIAEVARVLRPGGRLLIVDMLPHERQEYRQEMGHVWMGFSREQIDLLLQGAGLECAGFHGLPPQTSAQGPLLFTATARKPLVASTGGVAGT